MKRFFREFMFEKNNGSEYEEIHEIYDWRPRSKILGIEENRLGESLIIILDENTLLLWGQRYRQKKLYFPRIYFDIKTEEKATIIIRDVIMTDNNIGNGTIAMKALIRHARDIGAKEIKGSFSSIDDDHVGRRNYYYEKFGFEINAEHIRLVL